MIYEFLIEIFLFYCISLGTIAIFVEDWLQGKFSKFVYNVLQILDVYSLSSEFLSENVLFGVIMGYSNG